MEDEQSNTGIGAVLLIINKKDMQLQHSAINLDLIETLRIIRSFTTYLEDALIEQATLKSRPNT